MPRLKSLFVSRTGFVLFQCIFIILEMFVFYPCMVGDLTKEELTIMKQSVLKNRAVDDLSDPGLRQDDLDQTNIKNKLLHRMQYKHSVQKAESAQEANNPTKTYEPDWDSLDSRPIPEWYDDAKVGIFIHWGVFSVPSFVEVGQGGLAEWFWFYLAEDGHESTHSIANFRSVRRYMASTYSVDFRYQDFAPMFKAEFFNPNEWASLFKESGAKYVFFRLFNFIIFPGYFTLNELKKLIFR